MIANGQDAEDYACRYLSRSKLRIIERNYRCRQGEIDIIALCGRELVFIEVKYRKNNQYGHAFEVVSPTKQRKIITAAQVFLCNHPHYTNHPCRFDVFGLEYDSRHQLQATWIKSAFTTC